MAGPQCCELCGHSLESNCHIFLHCPSAVCIWEFFLSNAGCILDSHISDVFSLHFFSKYNVSRQCWCILVFAILWIIWNNRNAVIFRNSSYNIASSFFHIFRLASLWAGNLLGRQAAATSSATQAIQMMQQDWDSSQVV